MTESRYLPLPNTAAYHQMALVALIGFTRVTVITGRYPFSVGALILKLSVSLAQGFAIGWASATVKFSQSVVNPYRRHSGSLSYYRLACFMLCYPPCRLLGIGRISPFIRSLRVAFFFGVALQSGTGATKLPVKPLPSVR